ncbi:MAG: hypothetical protein JSR97_09420 [Verrucomicrobia bacterium]|nr:hypothetical protein [Verrucomicrobiota bacterium]
MRILSLSVLLLLSSYLNATNNSLRINEDTTLVVERFGWKISIPAGFSPTDAAHSRAAHERGAELIEKGTGVTIEDKTSVLFKYINGFTQIEALHQPLDLSNVTYLDVKKAVMDMMYQTFVSQMPNAKIDSSSTHEVIDGLRFEVITLSALKGDQHIFIAHTYSRMFDTTEFAVNVIYNKPELGEKLLTAFKSSTFKK